jgi:hypothetical protein
VAAVNTSEQKVFSNIPVSDALVEQELLTLPEHPS